MAVISIPSFRSGIASLVLVVGALSACDRNSPESYIASSKSFLEKRDYSAAIIELKNALQKAPNSGEARYLLGVALRDSGDPAAAEIELRKAMAAGFDRAQVRPALVAVLAETGQLDKVLKEAQPEEEKSAEARAALYAHIGDAYLGTGKLDDAKSAFAKALSADPSSPGGQLGLAKVSAIERNFPQAQALVDKVLAAAPQSLDALQLKADLLLAEGKEKEAATYFIKAIDLRPTAFNPYLSLVPLLIREKDLKGAAGWVAKLEKVVPKSPVASYLDALVAYSEGDRMRARESLRNVMISTPDYQPAILLAGAVEHDLGEFVQAEEYLLKVLEMTPAAVYPRRLLVSTYLRSGQTEKAKSALPVLIKGAPDDPTTWFIAGEVALRAREANKAAEYFEKAISLDPNNALSRTRLGQARLASGDTQRALRELEASAAADPNQYDADVALVTYYLNKREIDKAMAAVEVLKKKQPENPVTHNFAGMVLLAKRDRTGAREAFEHATKLQPTFYLAVQNLAAMDLQDKKPEAAAKRYEAILAKDPKHEEALIALIALKQRAGADSSAIEEAIDRAISVNPRSVRARLAKIDWLTRQGNFKGALTAAQQAQAALPDNVQVLGVLAKVQSLSGDSNQAVANFGKLSTMLPKSAAPFIGQAEAYVGVKDWNGAEEALRKALEREPNSVAALSALVRIGIVTGNLERAKTDARTLQKRVPDNVIGYIAEADVLAHEKRLPEAEALLRSKMKTGDAPAVTLRLFGLLNDQGKKAEADAVVNEWAARHPKDPTVAAYVAEYELSRKDFAAAARWYRLALKAQPGNVGMLNNLAWALGESGDPGALALGEEALAAAPDNAAVLDTVGGLYVKSGRLDKGVELLAKAVERAPRSPVVRLNYAKALIAAGRRTEAVEHLKEIAKLPTAAAATKEEASKLLAGS